MFLNDFRVRDRNLPRAARVAGAFGFTLMVCLLPLLWVTACANPALSQSGTKGSLTISFGTDQSLSRSVLDAAHSQAVADSYELIAAGSSHFYTTSIQPGQGTPIALEPDDYRVIVLAGNRRSATATTAVLVASAYSDQTVAIVAGQQSSVSLVLRPVDFTWTVPTLVDPGDAYTLSASGDSRNPYVGMLIDGTASSEHPRTKSVAVWNAYHDFASVTGNQSVWNAQLDLTAPSSSAVPLDFQFHGTYITLVGCGGNSGSLYHKTVYTWKWLNRFDLADGDPLIELVEKQTQVGLPQTALAVGIVWE